MVAGLCGAIVVLGAFHLVLVVIAVALRYRYDVKKGAEWTISALLHIVTFMLRLASVIVSLVAPSISFQPWSNYGVLSSLSASRSIGHVGLNCSRPS